MKPAEREFVSVVIPVYNLERYLAEAVESVLAQTHTDFEIILVDDGSTDRSREIMAGFERKYGDRIVCRYQEHRGASAARNSGVETARGDWVAFLDGDDLWKPDKLKIQLREARKGPGYDFLSTPAEIFGETRLLFDPVPDEPDIKVALMLKGCFIVLSSVLVRRERMKEIPFDESLPGAQDLDLYFRLADGSRFRFIPEPLVVYRIRKEAISDPETSRFLQVFHHYRLVKREAGQLARRDPVRFDQNERELKAVRQRLAHEAAYFSLSSKQASLTARLEMAWTAIRENPAKLKNYRFLMQSLLPRRANLRLQRWMKT